MKYDQELVISTGESRWTKVWSRVEVRWSAFVKRVSVPVRGQESLAEYLSWPKQQQDGAKDVGGFVGGMLQDGRRKATHVLGRQLLTLDLDHVGAGETESVVSAVEALNVAYVIYSTRKHESKRPRLRVVIPLKAMVSRERYERLAREVAIQIGMGWMDPTSFEACRLMYWPSCCQDSEFVFRMGDKPFLDGNNVAEELPVMSFERPWEKKGVIGDFCRKYTIREAIEAFIPGTYVQTLQGDRLTYVHGSTEAGAVLYEQGRLLYSFHATDPCSLKLVDAFDLVRLHKFGHLGERESRKAMLELVKGVIEQWREKITLNEKTQKPEATPWNVIVLLDEHPLLKGRLRKDLFRNRVVGVAPLPWAPRDKESGIFLWTDDDSAGLRNFVSMILGFRAPDVVKDGFSEVYHRHSFHPVRDYLNGLVWDRKPRVETMFIDWLAAKDEPGYTRLATKQFLKAMVKRAFEPGCEHQEVIVLVGEQGALKSSFLRTLSKGWYLDTLDSLETKIVGERTEGAWLVNLDELNAFEKTSENTRKEFISRREEKYRPAYGEFTVEILRSFVLAATTNRREFLGDVTGNRRYVPILCGDAKKVAELQTDVLFKEEVDQILAEAVVMYRKNPFIGIPKENWAVFDTVRDFFKFDNGYMKDVLMFLEQANYPERISLEWMMTCIGEKYKNEKANSVHWGGTRPSREQKLKIQEAIERTGRYKIVLKMMRVDGVPTRNGFIRLPEAASVTVCNDL